MTYRLGDDDWNSEARDETPTERLDRNWSDLLQELRVVQTGVQLLTAFLLSLPFQARFGELDSFERGVYLATVSCSVLATGLLIAPVMLHRWLFRRHARRVMVTGAHRLALAGTGFLGLAITGVVLLVFDLVVGRTGAVVAVAVTAVVLGSLWALGPLTIRWRDFARTPIGARDKGDHGDA